MKKFLLKTVLLLLALVAGSTSVWGQTDTYTFTSKSWEATLGTNTSNWTSGKDGNQLASGRGVQVTNGASGANATSPKDYSNVSQIVVTYSTNTSSGAGSISLQVGSNTAKSMDVTTTGGTSDRTLTYSYATKESGSVKLTVTCSTNSIYVKSVAITYEPLPTSVTLSPSSLDMAVGDDDEMLTASVLPAGANQSVTWTSSIPSVATVENGVVHAVAAGSTTITATSTVDGTKSASCTVTVAEATSPVATLSVSELAFGDVEVGQTKNLTFTVTPANLTGNLTIASDNAKYTVSPTSIAQGVRTAQTITVTAAPTDLADDMAGRITVSGGGITAKTVELSASPYQVANVALVATDSNGSFKQGEDVVTSVTSRVGSSATIKAMPKDGFIFLNWSAVGATPAASTNAEEEFTFTLATPTLTANFAREGINPTGSEVGSYYSLVTDASTLADGDQILLVATDQNSKTKSMSTAQNSNNRGDVEVTISENVITSIPATAQIITLEGETGAWYFNVGDGYLYAASSKSNWLRTQVSKDNNSKAAISISNEEATITFRGSNEHNLLRYNATSLLFACYNSGQTLPQIFRKEEGSSFDVTIGSTGWRTLVSAHNVALPSGVKAYIVTETDADEATLTEVASVKANTPVLLNGNADTYTLTIIDTPAEPTGNLLEISTANVSDNGCYVLAERNEKVGFYLWEGGSLGAGRVILPASAVSGVREFIGIGGGPDGINMVQGEGLKVQDYYDLSGRRVVKPTKGLYIVNGKKIMVK